MNANPLDQLDAALRTYFLTRYGTTEADRKAAFVAFQPIGVPLTDRSFQLGNPPVFSEMLSKEIVAGLSDVIGVVVGGTIEQTFLSLSDVVDLVAAGRPIASLSDDDKDFLARQFSSAQLELDKQRSTSSQGFGTYYPVLSTPKGWYEPAADCWTTYEFDSTQQTTTAETTTTDSAPAGAAAGSPWEWRVLPRLRQPLLEDPHLLDVLTDAMRQRVEAEPLDARLQRIDDLDVATRVATLVRPLAPPLPELTALVPVQPAPSTPPLVAARPTVPMIARPRGLEVAAPTSGAATPDPETAVQATDLVPTSVLLDTLASVTSEATATSVSTSALHVSFEHCLVQLDRWWLPRSLLGVGGWYVPLHQRGQITPPSGASAVAFPVAMIIVRNLLITGNWTTSDLTAATTAMSLGPLNLVGRSITKDTSSTTTTIRVEGKQLAGWICLQLPELAPCDAPT
jgi:hypothetical protein